MAKTIAKALRLDGIGEYYFSGKLAEIRSMNRSGEPVINLGIGSPDLPPHPEVIAEMNRQAVRQDTHAYQSYNGIPELREAVAAWYAMYFNAKIDPATQVLPLMGSKEGIFQLSLAYINPGDEVLVPDPGYPAYRTLAGMAGGVVRSYALRESTGWLPDLKGLEGSGLEKVKLMWVNYPHMPTGKAAGMDFFIELQAFGLRNGILIINDNPYSFILNDKPLSLFSGGLPAEGLVELNSLSKSHNMAGWRIGFMISHEKHIADTMLVSSNYQSGMFLALQRAAVKALQLDSGWYSDLNTVYRKRKNRAEAILEKLGCRYDPGSQGMFLWGRLPEGCGTGGKNSREDMPDDIGFSGQLLQKARVFLTPGSIFGKQGRGYIRISLCAKEEMLEKAIERINVLL